MQLTIFDLDDTLLAGDSDYLWGHYLVAQKIVDGDAYERTNRCFHADYQNGNLDIHAFQRFALQPLIDNPQARMEQLRRDFVATCIAPIVAPGTRDLLARHRERGDRLLIITSTNRFVTEPIAALLGIDDLLATDPEIVAGRYTGAIAGTPCFQAGKTRRLELWLAAHGPFEHITAYSDSHNDLPLLEHADTAVATDPDDPLEVAARERGWPVVSLRTQRGDDVFETVARYGG